MQRGASEETNLRNSQRVLGDEGGDSVFARRARAVQATIAVCPAGEKQLQLCHKCRPIAEIAQL